MMIIMMTMMMIIIMMMLYYDDDDAVVLTIETSPTNTAISGRSRKYWYAVPYPSSFHWWEGIRQPYPWEIAAAAPVMSPPPSQSTGTEKRLSSHDVMGWDGMG